jgi:hypothetical protein
MLSWDVWLLKSSRDSCGKTDATFPSNYQKPCFSAYPAAMASKLAGTAAVSRRRGSPELLASPSNAIRNSFSRLTYAARSSAPLYRSYMHY